MDQPQLDRWHMRRALELALRGQGAVEPNPMVGCVVVRGAEIIAEGWHGRFGGPHAEIEALAMAGGRAEGATLVVTLEPCCHYGKTPPCTKAVLAAGIRRVVIAQRDPFPKVAGGGIEELRLAGLEVELGVLEEEARKLNAPYLKLLGRQRPWVLAKWAMTLDGKTATATGESKWITSEESRRMVHEIRGRVDAIVIGRETARLDDPLLTARPPGPRTALRVVVDSRATLSLESKLVRTAREIPVLVSVGPHARPRDRERLAEAGCQIVECDAEAPKQRIEQLLTELGRRHLTNVLVEGGGRLTGSLLDARQIDEVHAFIAPRVLGGAWARTPVAGDGIGEIAQSLWLDDLAVRTIGPDVYIRGLVRK